MTDLVKIKSPPGVSSVSFDGVEYLADKKGVIEVPAECLGELSAHGFMVESHQDEDSTLPAGITQDLVVEPSEPAAEE